VKTSGKLKRLEKRCERMEKLESWRLERKRMKLEDGWKR
jgi:hypothetical protein